MGLSYDDGKPFASSMGDNRLTAIDLETNIVRDITLSQAPYHVTTIPGTSRLYVSRRTAAR